LPWSATRLLPAAAGALVAVLFALTLRQEAYWQDTRTLFAHALEVSPGDPLAQQALGHELLQEGKLDQAEAMFREVLRQSPGSGRGGTAERSGRAPAAFCPAGTARCGDAAQSRHAPGARREIRRGDRVFPVCPRDRPWSGDRAKAARSGAAGRYSSF